MAEQTQTQTPTETGLLQKLEALAARLTSQPDDGEPAPGKSVPYERFSQVNDRRRIAEEGLAGVRKEIEAMETRHKAAIEEMRKAQAAYTVEAERRRAEDVAFARTGIDDAGIETIRLHWRRQPETEREKSAGEWWAKQVAAHLEHAADDKKPAPKLHATLSVLLPAVEKKQETRPRPGLPPRGEPAKTGEPVLGRGRKAYLESIGRLDTRR